MENEAAAFASFVRNHTEGASRSNDIQLFSVCFRARRGWESGKTWKDEIKKYAEAHRYEGSVSSFDPSTVPVGRVAGPRTSSIDARSIR